MFVESCTTSGKWALADRRGKTVDIVLLLLSLRTVREREGPLSEVFFCCSVGPSDISPLPLYTLFGVRFPQHSKQQTHHGGGNSASHFPGKSFPTQATFFPTK